MHFQVLTLFPEMVRAGLSEGIVAQALKKNLFKVDCLQLRDFATDAHRHVDDRPFGGGDGMILMPDLLERALGKASETGAFRRVYLSPQGRRLDDRKVRELAREPGLTLICGRYGGIDQRALLELVDEELSIGDYVLSGGELPALVLIDAVARQIPGVLGHEASADEDSFSEGVLESPQFTRPREWRGLSVPEVLLSGDHRKIREWRRGLSRLVTLRKRPDLLTGLSEADWKALEAFWRALSPTERKMGGVDGLREADFQGKSP